MPGAQCTRSLACEIKQTHELVTTVTPEITRHSPRNGFNGFLRALPGDRACLSPSSADMARQNPVGLAHLHKLDAGVEASEPHDFAVRFSIVRQRAIRSLTGLVDPPCHPLASPDAAASTASRPASVTIAIRPSEGRNGDGYKSDLGQARTEI